MSEEESRGIRRGRLELIIRRAAELSFTESDADEELSEEEVLRIAAELGLPERAVRQALYEAPAAESPPAFLDRTYGPDHIVATRAVPSPAPQETFARLADYLTVREYMQMRRRQEGSATFVPADDTVTNVLRMLFRSSRRHHIASSNEVMLQVRPLETGWSHVLIDLNIAERRRSAFKQSLFVGTLAGSGSAAGMVAGIASVLAASGAAAEYTPIILIGAGAATFAGAFSIAAATIVSRFRTWVRGAREEVAGLLDRAERGERLAPPPAPWWRKIQMRASGRL